MRVVDYVLLGRTAHLGFFEVEGDADLDVAVKALADLDAGPLADRTVDTLSGGERQRIVIARALAQESPVLLLDEPTTALDVGHQQEVLDLVDRLRSERNLTVLATMHDLTLAGQYADLLVMLDAGVVAAAGSADEVLTEEAVNRHYGARVRVVPDEAGPIVVPVRRAGSDGA
jgi:iron complex transport system ATP-binding protein